MRDANKAGTRALQEKAVPMLARLIPRRLAHRAILPFRALSVGVRGIVTHRDNTILLIRHTYAPGWHFPGGGVHPGETAREAVRREIAEETGIMPSGKLDLVGVYLNRRLHARDHVLLFKCGPWERKRPFSPGLEIAEARFFPLADLPSDLSLGTARRIQELFEGATPREEW